MAKPIIFWEREVSWVKAMLGVSLALFNRWLISWFGRLWRDGK
jgi:hypothetical protein